MAWSKEEMCKVAEKELKDGYYVNLGIGMPTEVADHIDPNKKIILHSENGVLGVGRFPESEIDADPDLINAGKQAVTALPYTCYFDNATSFMMLRGGHLDITLLGAFQVSEYGDIANWMIPGKMVNGMGGAMDIIAGVKRVVVLMSHNANDGSFKIVKKCSLPLTGVRAVHRVITNLCVFDITKDGLHLVQKADDVSIDEIRSLTEPNFTV